MLTSQPKNDDNQDPTIEQLTDSDPRVQRLKSMGDNASWSEMSAVFTDAKPTEDPQDPQEVLDQWVRGIAAAHSVALAGYYDRPVVKLRRSEVLAWATRVGLVPGSDPKSPT